MKFPFTRKGLEDYLDERLDRYVNDLQQVMETQNRAQMEFLFVRLKEEMNRQLDRRINDLQRAVEEQNVIQAEILFARLKEEMNLQLDRRINDLQQAMEAQDGVQTEVIFAQLKEEMNLQFDRRINDLQRATEAQNGVQTEVLLAQFREEMNLQLDRRINDLQRATEAQNGVQTEVLFAQFKEEMNLQFDQRINDLQKVVIRDIREMHGDLYGFFGRFPKMLSFEVPLADHCNLNCAGCSHFSPLASPSFMGLEEFTRDFERMAELFEGNIRQIRLMGGEPLLNHDINKYLAVARKCFPQTELIIVTNGLLLPQMDESFWETCRENQIVIAPTKYPIDFDYDAAEELAKAHGVKFQCFSDRETTKVFDKYALDPQGLQNCERNYRICSIPNPCPYLRNGRLYLCPIPPTVHYMNEAFGTNFEESPQDSIDIYQARSAEEILEFLARPIPFCRYCKRDANETIPWGQSKRELSEWTL